MWFNEPDYVTVHSVINIMATNGAKMTRKNATLIFLSYYYLTLVGKELLQAHNDKYCSLVKLLCISLCYFILLNHVNQCLTKFFCRNYVSLERSPLDEAKKSIKPLKKQKCKKCQRLIHFFNKEVYTHNKFVIEKWFNRPHFFIDAKNLQKFGLTGELISV